MTKRLIVLISAMLTFAGFALGQDSNTSTQTTNTSIQSTNATNKSTRKRPATKASSPGPKQSPKKSSATEKAAPGSALEAFNNLINGIKKADVEAATNAYLNSPRLLLFNYNGTVTRGWEQLHQNRASSYPNMKDVKLDIRDLHVEMLGPNAAVITCLWTQTDTYKGQPDSASGRMTIVFRRTDGAWKAIHLHTSPDSPDASRVPASEQTPSGTPPPTPTP
jgi:ketosteroid isomerase-like protein